MKKRGYISLILALLAVLFFLVAYYWQESIAVDRAHKARIRMLESRIDSAQEANEALRIQFDTLQETKDSLLAKLQETAEELSKAKKTLEHERTTFQEMDEDYRDSVLRAFINAHQ